MEYIIVACIVLAFISWIMRSFVIPVANVVQTVSNNNFVKEYVLNNNLQNAMHFITTIKEGNTAVITNVLLAEDGIHFPMPNGNHIKISMDSIQYFVKEGDVSYTNQVYSSGRRISFGKAIVGGIIAGPIGAVVGGASGAEKLENSTVVHDNTETYIYYFVNKDNVAVLSVNGIKFYQNLKLRFPHKEYGHLEINDNDIEEIDQLIDTRKTGKKQIKMNNKKIIEELPEL